MIDRKGGRDESLFRESLSNAYIIKGMFVCFFSLFSKDDIENAKYISRLFATRHKFYKQNKICTE